MSLVRLVYYSRNRLDPSRGALADRVSEILSVSVANNRKADISGGLIFNGDWFAQALEGDRLAVMETFARIQRDERHGDIATVESRLIETRRFSRWWMAAAQHRSDAAFTPYRLDGEATCDLMSAALNHQMNTPTESTAPHWLFALRNPDAPRRAPRSCIVKAA